MSKPGIRRANPPAGWFAGLDGLRALAVCAVLVYHFQPTALPGGFLGVDLFFVVSGYLITRLLLDEIDRCGDLSLLDFYVRRARRLLPALFTLLGVVTLAAVFVWHDAVPTLRQAVPASVGYVANWWLISDHQSYFVSTGRPPMLQHLWSLAIEEQFYLIWPVVLVLLIGADLRHRRVAVLTSGRLLALAAAGVASAVASTVAMAVLAIRADVPYGADSGRVYFGTDTHAMGLLLGAAAGALAVRGRFGVPRPILRGAFHYDLAALVAGGALLLVMLRVDEFAPGLYRGGFLGISALGMVLVAAVPRRGSAVGWLLDREPLRWVGRRSYAIYLWHWPVAVVTRPDLDLTAAPGVVFALRVLITLVLADLSYRLVEVPIRTGGFEGLVRAWHVGRLSPATRSRLAPAVLAGFAVLVGSVAVGVVPGPSSAQAGEAQVAAHRAPLAGPTAVPIVAPVATPLAPPASATASAAASPQLVPRPVASRPGTAGPVAPVHRAVAPAEQPGRNVRVTAFGDSVMLGAAPALLARLPRAKVYAVEGRQARAVFADIAARDRARQLAPVVVIHTGDNGIISPRDLTDALESLRDRTRVIVVTDRVPRDWQAPNNHTLADVVPKFRNAVLVDWYRRSAKHREWFYNDGLHLRPAGAKVYADLIAAEVR